MKKYSITQTSSQLLEMFISDSSSLFPLIGEVIAALEDGEALASYGLDGDEWQGRLEELHAVLAEAVGDGHEKWETLKPLIEVEEEKL